MNAHQDQIIITGRLAGRYSLNRISQNAGMEFGRAGDMVAFSGAFCYNDQKWRKGGRGRGEKQ